MRSIVVAVKKPRWRWLERMLLLVGIVCLGTWAYAWLDTAIYQYRENRLLDEAVSDRARPSPAVATETDSLDTFRGGATAMQRTSGPIPEGSLVGRIEIPRLEVSAIVLEGTGKKTLRRGVGHIAETPFPEQGGNVGLAAHRDSFFRGLKDVRENDLIMLKTLEGTYDYRVEWTAIVLPEETQVLQNTGAPALTLVTCYPFHYVGAAPERFIVRARRVEEADAGGP